MSADAERTIPKENSRAIFTMLDDQCLRAHGKNFLGCSRQIRFPRKHLHFAIIDQQYVYQLKSFNKIIPESLDPVIHSVAASKAHIFQLVADSRLQCRMNVS